MWSFLCELHLTWAVLVRVYTSRRERRYHQTVGRNCVIELAWSVNRSGLVHPMHARRYAEFGEWIRKQYGPPPHFNERYSPSLHTHFINHDACSARMDCSVLNCSVCVGSIDGLCLRYWRLLQTRWRGLQPDDPWECKLRSPNFTTCGHTEWWTRYQN
jgi:hypothetical protein